MDRNFNIQLLNFAFLFCCILSSCVSVSSISGELNEENIGYRSVLAAEKRKTNQQLAERRQLQSQLGAAQYREAELTAGGVTLREEAELSEIRQNITSLKKQLSALATAG
jgi:hypothetical protein